jgi:hypothetical protein
MKTANLMRAALITLMLALALAGCSPSLNWREVRMEGTSLVALMPCKPETLSRTIPFVGGKTRTLSMSTCEVEGATFALTMADMADEGLVQAALVQWDKVTREHVRVGQAVEQSMMPPGASPNPYSRMVVGKGQRPGDGQPMQVHMAYFSKGSQVFQAVLYAPVSLKPEVAETFLTGMKFQ